MTAIYVSKDTFIIVDNQNKGLCLISSLFQGMGSTNADLHQCQSMITKDIVSEWISSQKPYISLQTSRILHIKPFKVD